MTCSSNTAGGSATSSSTKISDTNYSAVSLAQASGAGAHEHLLRWANERPVDLWRRGAEVGNTLGSKRISRPHGSAGTELPFHGPYPLRRLWRHRGQQGAAWQDPSGPRARTARSRLIGHWDGEEEAPGSRGDRAMGHGTRGNGPDTAPTGSPSSVRASHPDAAFEDRFPDHRSALSRDRRPRFYERNGDPRCDGLFPASSSAPRTSRLRADREHAQARPWRQGGGATIQKLARANVRELVEGARLAMDSGGRWAARARR